MCVCVYVCVCVCVCVYAYVCTCLYAYCLCTNYKNSVLEFNNCVVNFDKNENKNLNKKPYSHF